MYLIHQESSADCLFTCFKVVLANLSHEKEYLYLPNMKDTAYSFADIKENAKEFNLNVTGLRLKDKHDLFQVRDKYLILTLIRDNTRHAIVLVRLGKRRSKIVDPNLGLVTVKTESLLKEWDSYMLSLTLKSGLAIPRPNSNCLLLDSLVIYKLKLPRGMTSLFTIKFISSLCLVLGLGFIESREFLIPLSLLAAFALFEVLYQFLLVRKMRQVDDLFFSSLRRSLKNKEELETYENYKSQMIAKPITIIYAFLVSLFLLFLLIYNSIYNLIFIAAVIICVFARKVLLSTRFDKEKEVIDSDEASLFSDNNNDVTTFKEKFNALHSKVYHYTYTTSIYKYVETFILIIAIVLSMYLEHILSLTYVLLYYASSYYLKENIDKVMGYKESLNEYKLTRAKYSSMMARMNREMN